MKLLDKMKALMAIKKVRIGVSIVLSVAVVAAGGATIYTVMNDKPATSQETKVEKKKKTEKKKEKELKYETFHMSSDSMEKDLTVYFMDDNNQKIAGSKFAVKLVKPEEATKLEEQLNEMAKINEQIKPSDEDNTDTSEEKGTENSEKTDSEDTNTSEKKTGEEKSILEKKSTAIEAYAKALDKLDGQVFTDDDKDGMITQQELEPGEYVLCYIPTDMYDASEYTIKSTVKDKVEYKVVEDIEKKKVSYAAAGDTQGAGHNVEVQATLTDTVPWVDSKTENVEVVKPAECPSLVASKGERLADGVLTFERTANLYASAAGNSVDIVVEPRSGVAVTSQDAGAVAVTDLSGGTYRLTTNASVPDTRTVNVTVSDGTNNGTCAVTVVGANTPLKDANNNQLYMDEGATQVATVGNYNPAGAYYIKTTETRYYGWQIIDGKRYYFDADGNPVSGKQVIGGVQYTFDSTGEVLTRSAGIDVSKWQGNIDWSQVKSAVSFAIVRAGFRGSSGGIAEDPKAGANIQGASSNGIKVGLYFYSIAQNEAQAVEEASLAVAIARKYGGVSLPIYIDMEDSRQLGLSTAQRDAIVMAFCRTVQSAGYSAGVYANKNWFTNYLTPSSYGNISIWLAQYNTEVTYKGRYDIWQYSSKGSIPGISGNVDLNVSFF